MSILLISTVFTLLFRLARRKSNAIVALVVTMVAAAASSVHWLARPHLFTLLFVVLFYGALERVRDGRTHVAGVPYLALLPAATILWTNLHGGFFVGILMIAAYGGGELLRVAFSADGEERGRLGGEPAGISCRRRAAWRPAWPIRTSIACTCTCGSTCAIRTSRSTSWSFFP